MAEEMNNDEFEHVRSELETYDPSESKKLAILVSTGSLNPVHLGHVNSFQNAKKQLEKQHDFKILGGFLSPSDSGWCSRKKHGCFSNEFRLKLVKLAVAETSWIKGSGWEISQGKIDFPPVCYRFSEELQKQFPEHEIEVLYLCGVDHANKCGLMIGRYKRKFGCAIMTRPGYTNNGKASEDNRTYLIEGEEIEASSTEIRSALVTNKLYKVKGKLHADVFKALQADDAEKLGT